MNKISLKLLAFCFVKKITAVAVKIVFAALLVVIVLPLKLFAQAPSISYSSPQTYTAGTTITSLVPASSGVAAYSINTVTLGSGFSNPAGVAVDATGNIYVGDDFNNAVKKIPVGGGSPVTIGSGFIQPLGVAVDGAGNVYVADWQHSAIKKIPVGGGVPVTIGSGFSNPTGVAVDAAGNVYVADGNNNAVKKIPVGGGSPVSIGSGFNYPSGVAVDKAGNVYVADNKNNAVKEIPVGGGTPITLGSGFITPYSVAVDAAGNVYVADRGNNAIKEIPAGGGNPTSLGAGFNHPLGVAVDGAGNVYLADTYNNAIKEITKPVGGYFISPDLPVGLSFNHNTGSISGTPTISSPATNYVVTAYNSVGSNSATVNITVKTSANLSNLVINSGTLSPAFAPAILNYAVTEDNVTTFVQVTPTSGDASATMKVNGVSVSQGTASLNLPLAIGPNSISTVVTGTDGIANTYTITVTRPPSSVSYTSPHTYVTGSAITALAPTGVINSGGGYSSNANVFNYGFIGPDGIAFDASGNLYVALASRNAVMKIPPGGGTPVTIGSGFNSPYAVAVDAAGNVYVADFGNNAIKEILAASGTIVTLGSGFSGPAAIAVDKAGNVYVADAFNGAIKMIPVGGGAPVTLGSTFSSPFGVAVDASGNVFATDFNNGLYEMPAGGGAQITISTNFNNPNHIAIDAKGNVYVTDTGNGLVKEFLAGSVNPVIVGPAFGGPFGVAIDPTGNLFVTDGNFIKQIKPLGGSFINPALPAGLSFDNTQGIISGTPTAASPATNYTVTAYNNSGGNSAVVNIAVTLLTPPNVSYTSPQTYAAGIAISPLSPANAGGAVAAVGYNTSTTTIGSGFSLPNGVAVDAAGNVYVADYSHNAVKKIPAGNGTPVTIGSGFSLPRAVAVDAAGNVYVADGGNNAIKKIPVAGGAVLTLGSGFSLPNGVAVDAAGNVYVGDYGNNAVKMIPLGSGTPVVIGSGFNHPRGVAVDAAGNVFVADGGNTAVKEIPVGGGAPVTLGTGFALTTAVAVDASGNVYISDYGNNAIKMIAVGGGTPVSIGSGFSSPFGVAVDGAGKVYVGDLGHNAVKVINPTGGYYINTSLPAGLTFLNATGVISGTPPAVSPAKNYTITAYNAVGSSQAIVNITVSTLPTISYTGPQTYTAGVAISPLSPTSTGVASIGYNTNTALIGSGFSLPNGLAVDATGNVYVADYSHNAVKKIPVGGGAPVTLGSGFSLPRAVAVDAAGNVYVADGGNNAIKKVPVGGGAVVTLGSGFSQPNGVAVDAAGNVYVGDYGNNAVKKIPLGSGTPAIIGSGFNHPRGVAVDAAGNVFVADGGNTAIKKIPAGGGAPVTLGSGFALTTAVTVDASGNVYVSDYGNNAIKMIPVGGGAPVSIGSGFSSPFGVAVDGAGKVYVGDLGNNAVKTIKPTGGYYINTSLPTGLTFANATGMISGTPTVSNPATNYTVTAYNAAGSGPATVNIKVAGNATLASLAISSGKLTPVFTSATTSYLDTVINTVASVTVTPTVAFVNSSIKVNGTTVNSGTASAAIPLAVGNNTITTVVTAQDGVTTKTYTITVRRLTPGGLNSLYLPGRGQQTAMVSFLNEKVVANNILSPNGDGINDIWVVKNIAFYPNNRVTVYDKAGVMVFTKNGYANDWNGTYRGTVLSEGTYYYLVDLGNGSTVKGFITVMRDR